MLPAPKHSIYGNTVPKSEDNILLKDGFENILQAFENPSWIGVLRTRWKEIKKLIKAQQLGIV